MKNPTARYVFGAVLLISACGPAETRSTDGGETTTGGGTTEGGTTEGGTTGGGEPTGDLSFSVRRASPTLPEALTLSWPATEGDATLEITQGATTVSIPAAAGASEVVVTIPGPETSISEADLTGLTPGEASYSIVVGGEAVYEGTFTVIERFTRQFAYGNPNQLEIVGLPQHAEVGAEFSFPASLAGADPEVYIGRPDDGVDIIALGDTYTFSLSGLYAVEVNKSNGLPAANLPVYIGGGVPLAIPELDISTETYDTPFPAEQIRTAVLDRVNAVRTRIGVGPVALADALNQIADTKAQQMATAKTLCHGCDGVDKAKVLAEAAGLTGQISENISVDINAVRTFWMWYWSPSHRSALIDPAWKSMGLGFASWDAMYKQLAFAQHFSDQSL